MPKKFSVIGLLRWAILSISCFALGVAVDHYRVFPYEGMRYAYNFLKYKIVQGVGDSNPGVASQSFDVNDLMTISSVTDAADRQLNLIRFFWKDGAFPVMKASATDSLTSGLETAHSRAISELIVRMPYGFDIRASFTRRIDPMESS